MQPKKLLRLFKALQKKGLDTTYQNGAYRVALANRADGPVAEVLLPPDFPVEVKALKQLAQLAEVHHPNGGKVTALCATPDFHPGDAGVAIGSVVQTKDMVIPAAVGSDINCGMRLHTTELNLDRFLAGKDRLVALLRGDYLLGSRDVTQTAASMQALFSEGLIGWTSAMRDNPSGMATRCDFHQLECELDRVFANGSMAGDPRWAPPALLPDAGLVRDDGLGTIGGGNHFVEFQVVEELLDTRAAYRAGIKQGQVAFMIHSGSRHVGKFIGKHWRMRAEAAWPKGLPYPTSRLFPLSQADNPDLVAAYLEAEATAANYAFLNRMLLAEIMRQRMRQVFGEVAAPLVYDLPHNITLPRGDGWITRKGACPAESGQWVIIPGSMGTASYLLEGLGSERFHASASHGAGRARSRFAMSRGGADKSEAALGLTGVTCITLREERRIEEAPNAYKPIQPIIKTQQAAGMVRPVAKLRPILTFKA
ncbi:RtcB family protein [Acanthopleuribacter pedis]|uniref:tRNA-splicing ligase RtcB n=1 Tax=Acanthopleuribacter pedis TaxID=442870 RepID=A0A8J7U4C3_9BACT|nr:RtcB family protein [Acanthopleuribacter pedis]MBO1320492.1 RtcB family protein [Acanthopleuribacter pedis]